MTNDFLQHYRTIRLNTTTGNPVERSEHYVDSFRRTNPTHASLIADEIDKDVSGWSATSDLPSGALIRIVKMLRYGRHYSHAPRG